MYKNSRKVAKVEKQCKDIEAKSGCRRFIAILGVAYSYGMSQQAQVSGSSALICKGMSRRTVI